MTARSCEMWWRGALIYQVYPRSYQDSNDDGIGDLAGLIQRLPYIAALGVDAIWVSPFFKSPQKDFGYDISAYREVDPIFGTITDCDRLIEQAHKLGLKVIFDAVLSHTSDQHPWFADSRRRLNGRDDWYVWADPKPDGSPPNNWVSLFGGPAWSFDPLRGQYYMHNFLTEQPDLNFHNPDVQDTMLDIVRFWLDRGVDGLRLDTVNFYFHDRALRDNPPRPPELGFALQFDHPDPYSMQRHVYDKSQPENLAFIERLRGVLDTYDDRMLVGEIGDDYQVRRMAEYTQGHKRLHTAYCFALLAGTDVALTPAFIRRAIEDDLAEGQGWPTWAFSNHDVPRAPSRFGNRYMTSPDWPKLLLAVLLALRGTICVYQGEELGLPEASVPYDRLQDPWGRHVWPVWQGRDGCRTPIPWNDAQPNKGFSNAGQTWLPVAPEHDGRAVAAQESDPASVLHFFRTLTAWRRAHPALSGGDIAFHDAPDGVLALTRTRGDQSVLCVFNLTPDDKTIVLSARLTADALASQATGTADGGISLAGFGFALIPQAVSSNSLA